MKTENKILMQKARESLAGNWKLAVGTFFVFNLINGISGANKEAGAIIGLIIGGPMSLGAAIFSLNLAKNKKAEFSQIFDGFKNFAESLVAYLLIMLYVLLWTLLLIIPGIIAAISYSQVFYILADEKNIKAAEAIKKSKTMMYGFKWKFFCLALRFSGWFVLSILTLGIGFLWFFPYVQVSFANFYEDVKK